MKRLLDGVPAFGAVVLMSLTLEPMSGMVMQLHRIPRHDHHSERYLRRLNIEEEAPEVVPLHLGLGTHYTWVYAGTPPQRASVIVDTGSALMAFPCSGCDGCGNHTDQPFDTVNSSTLVHVTCEHETIFRCSECKLQSDTCKFSQSYLEGSTWKATVVEDIVYLGGDSSFHDVSMRNHYGTHFQFGCQNAETGLFVTQVADGIMGLSNADNHIVAKLHRENKIPNNLFSLCFTENGGSMAIGEPFKSAHRGSIDYVKLLADRSTTHFYNVNMKDIRINNVSIQAKEEAYTRGHYIIDSGTTDSYLPLTLKNEFLKVFQEVSGREYQSGDKCKSFTITDLASLPTIQLVMEAYGDDKTDVILNVPPEQYLFATNGAYCGNLYLSENSGGVIGANLMMGRDVIFDLGNQRVGFVDADCAFDGVNSTTPPLIHKSINVNAMNRPTAVNQTNVSSHSPTPSSETKPSAVLNVSTPQSASTSLKIEPPGTVEPSVDLNVTVQSNTKETAAITESTSDSSSMESEAYDSSSSDSEAFETSSLDSEADTVTTSDMHQTIQPSSLDSEADTVTTSDINQTIQPLSNDRPEDSEASSSSAIDHTANTKSSGTHPLVLTIVGAVLVVGFLVMMFISVSRRRQKDGKEQLWSRVKGDEADEDDDDEEEFGLVRNEKQTNFHKHQRLQQEEKDHSDSSSNDDEDEVFDRNVLHEESKTEQSTLDRL
ncbi:putative aspartic peptidase A1 family, aspartic peptidase domain superfamily, xylanase inhibitor [Plasmopara halstedii]